MSDAPPTDSSLEAAAGAAGPHATEAFALLGNETRLAILLALWEEYDPHDDVRAVPFSRIFDRVAYDDPGNLRYHLEKLQGQFIRHHDERGGYELRNTGLKLVRAVIAGAGLEEKTLEPVRIDQPCPLCDAATAVSYRDGLVIHACTDCAGPTPEAMDTDGFLSATPFPPAGLGNRSGEELRMASRIAARRQVQMLFDGICPDCSGWVDSWLECCPDHDASDICSECGRLFGAWARFQCEVCKNHSVASPKALALFHPAVIGFYDDHGISTRVHVEDIDRGHRIFELMDAHEMALVAADPPRVDVTAAVDGDDITVTFDDTVRVVDVRR